MFIHQQDHSITVELPFTNAAMASALRNNGFEWNDHLQCWMRNSRRNADVVIESLRRVYELYYTPLLNGGVI